VGLFRTYIREMGRCLKRGAPFVFHYCFDPEAGLSGKEAFCGYGTDLVESWLWEAGLEVLDSPHDFVGDGKAVKSRVQTFAHT
jgi:hypothetical protein